MIAVLGHASIVKGQIFEAPVNTLVETLVAHKSDFIHLRHSIDGQIPSIVYVYESSKVVREEQLKVISKISVLRYISEIFLTYQHFAKQKNSKEIVFIGADPLNAVSGVLLKKMGKISKAIFYTVDYTKTRFGNKILNWCYQQIDQHCIKNADEVWNVSSRIYALRKKLGVPAKKNLYIPNMPSEDYKAYLQNKRERFTLITLGILGEQLDFSNLFKAMKSLEAKFPELKLKIAGDGPKRDELEAEAKELGLSKKVDFLGYISHDQALEAISKSGVGLALYNGNWSFNYYGDSMKCREFFCFGLPVMTTDTHSTADDIRENKTGEVVAMDAKAYEKALIQIFSNYETLSKNSLELSKKYDDIHWQMMKRFEK
jgi:glycosyltransferase involved in cell wall biosynthesis